MAQKNGHEGALCLDGHDFYWLEEGWYGGDIFGLWDYMVRAKPRPLAFFGRYIPTPKFREIAACARRDTLES